MRTTTAERGAMTGVSTLTDYVQAYEPDIERVLISSDEIQAKLAEMGSGSRPTTRARRSCSSGC